MEQEYNWQEPVRLFLSLLLLFILLHFLHALNTLEVASDEAVFEKHQDNKITNVL